MHGENVEIGPLSDATIAIIEFMGIVTGPIRRGDGIALAVVLVDPKFRTTPAPPCEPRPAAGCSRYGPAVTGAARWAKRQRLPREERMRGYKEVEVRQGDQSFDAFEDAVPVAVELRRIAESLIGFVHLGARICVFEPEARVTGPGHGGPVPPVRLGEDHRHCANLSAAVYTVIYDRQPSG